MARELVVPWSMASRYRVIMIPGVRWFTGFYQQALLKKNIATG
jgi:hypothetical protein